MARTLDQILVVDVESTCWDGPPPDGEASDIIEIGVCLLDVATLERSERRGLWVRPERSRVSPFCTELTTIRPEDVADAPSLKEACKSLSKQLLAPKRTWASYGDYDRRQFERNCADLGVRFPFGPTHLNVKNLFGLILGPGLGLDHEVGMSEALDRLGLPLEGTHHRGVDDAWNIAAILADLLRRGRR